MAEFTEAEVIRDLAFTAAKPQVARPGERYVWLVDGVVVEHDLTDVMPARKAGTVQVANVASFSHYYGKHGDDDSEVFVDIDHAQITAVLDAHGTAARYQGHRLVLALAPTLPWQTWTARNDRWMTQKDFAEFLEMNAADVAPGAPVTAADLLEVSRQFQAHTKVSYESGTRLSNGTNHLVYKEEIEAKAGDRGQIDIPAEFQLGIKPYEDCPQGYLIKAWFRYQIREGALQLKYVLDDPARKALLAVEAIVGQVAADLGITVMVGADVSPARIPPGPGTPGHQLTATLAKPRRTRCPVLMMPACPRGPQASRPRPRSAAAPPPAPGSSPESARPRRA
jgi:uncharacterized protein YfdQ (DUF2303 family)